MAEELNIEIELCGHKGRITHIWASEAHLPWRPLDTLRVEVEFDEPHPGSIISIAFDILPKDYSQEELLTVIKKVGEMQFIDISDKHLKEREERRAQQKRREELDALAKRLEERLKWAERERK